MITVNVQKAASVNAEIAHVLVEVPHVFRNRVNEGEMAAAIASKIHGGRMMSNSLHKTEAEGMYGVFVATSRASVPVEQASAKGFTKVSDTVFQDADDNIWQVQSDASGSYLAQQGSEDIAGLLQAVQVRSIATASVGIELEEHVNANEPVLFYDTETENTAFGVGLGDNRVYVPDTNEVAFVAPTKVLAVYSAPTGVEFADSKFSSEKGSGLKAALAYYTELYGHNAEFLNRIRAMLKEVVTA